MSSATAKAQRKLVPRSAHADWHPATDRPSPVDVIVSQNTDRLQWLVPVRHWRMARSPFAFFRGAAKVMALDLTNTPTTGIRVQLGGDAHLSNFGFYGSPERDLVFDLNDFDETLPGPWEWDVKRLAASFVVAARNNGFDEDEELELATGATEAYRKSMKRLSGMGYLDIWYSRIDDEDIREVFGETASKKDMERFRRAVRKMRGETSRHAVKKLTEATGSGLRIKSDPPLIIPLRDLEAVARPEELQSALTEAWEAYLESVPDQLRVLLERFRLVDLAVKVVGVGSVGTRCFIVLLVGHDETDPLFLQVKQATRSVLEDHLPPSGYPSAGQRVVEGQRLMQSVSDIFLGWTTADASGHDYYWRQLKDMKGSADVGSMDQAALRQYARLCGATLAKAHARSGDPGAIAGYLGKSDGFDQAVGQFAKAYADQNDADYQQFELAVTRGEIPAHE